MEPLTKILVKKEDENEIGMEYSDTKHIQAVIPAGEHKALRVYCVENEVTLNLLLQQIVAEWIQHNITLKEVENGQEENDKNL